MRVSVRVYSSGSASCSTFLDSRLALLLSVLVPTLKTTETCAGDDGGRSGEVKKKRREDSVGRETDELKWKEECEQTTSDQIRLH